MFKDRKLIFMIFTFACFIAMGVCLIVDLATSHQVTWAAYPLLSIPFGWLSATPLLFKKHGAILSLCTLTLIVFPFLYFIEKITPVTGWFSPLGLPSAVVGIVAGWVLYFFYRFIKVNLWYKAAVTVFLLGAVADPIISYFVNAFTGESSLLGDIISVLGCIAVSAILGILGYRKNAAKKAKNNH